MRATAAGQLHVYPKEAMHKTILLVSRDEALRTTRTTILEKARQPTIQASRMQSTLQLAAYCQLAIIDATLSIAEHDEFLDGIRDQDNHACVLCIRSGLTHPVALLDAVQDCPLTADCFQGVRHRRRQPNSAD
jgi:DNA-binding GntR family transcriptional regulator